MLRSRSCKELQPRSAGSHSQNLVQGRADASASTCAWCWLSRWLRHDCTALHTCSLPACLHTALDA